jgi:hypothetical protein
MGAGDDLDAKLRTMSMDDFVQGNRILGSSAVRPGRPSEVTRDGRSGTGFAGGDNPSFRVSIGECGCPATLSRSGRKALHRRPRSDILAR